MSFYQAITMPSLRSSFNNSTKPSAPENDHVLDWKVILIAIMTMLMTNSLQAQSTSRNLSSSPFGSYRQTQPAFQQAPTQWISPEQTLTNQSATTTQQTIPHNAQQAPIPQQQPFASPMTAGLPPQMNFEECLNCDPIPVSSSIPWGWVLLPDDFLWKSYLGGPREPRLASQILHLSNYGWLWELEAGGRAGVIRYGSPVGGQPEGWQLDVWGAAFPRLNFEENLDVDAVDFKVGVPLSWRSGPWQFKFEWYHISSHVGDEFLLRGNNAVTFNRLDYLRDAFVLGGGYFVTPDLRVYGEVEWAYNTGGGSQPWQTQFGFDYSPICPNTDFKPSPFFAVNASLREEVNWGGGVNVVAGIQWRGGVSDNLFRFGLQYYNGESFQYSFFDDHEELLGLALWYDF